VWTADRDIDPGRIDGFLKGLNTRSFVILDKSRGYEMELPGSTKQPRLQIAYFRLLGIRVAKMKSKVLPRHE
jgi:hypothetical protein